MSLGFAAIAKKIKGSDDEDEGEDHGDQDGEHEEKDAEGSDVERDHQDDELDKSEDMAESDENEVHIYYEAEEIEMNRRTQATDQFEDLLRMRMSASTPAKNRFNIQDYMPKDLMADAKKAAALKKKK